MKDNSAVAKGLLNITLTGITLTSVGMGFRFGLWAGLVTAGLILLFIAFVGVLGTMDGD